MIAFSIDDFGHFVFTQAELCVKRVGKRQMQGIHLEQGDTIRIEGNHSSVILDGELFEASEGKPIVLRSTQPVPFLRLAA